MSRSDSPRTAPGRLPRRPGRVAIRFGFAAAVVSAAFAFGAPAAVAFAQAGDEGESVDEELLERGRLVYRTQCQSCHGREGKGDGPASRFLDDPPADLTDDTWEVAENGSLEEIVRVIREGVEGTGMEPMGEILDEDEVRAVAVYVRQVVAKAAAEGHDEGTGRDGGEPAPGGGGSTPQPTD